MSKKEIMNAAIDNWEVFQGLLHAKIENSDIATGLLDLCETQSERIIVAPASSRSGFVGPFVGGLVWHSLNVLKTMNKLANAYDLNVNTDDLVLVGLFHDVGKIGDETKDYYVAQDSGWHRDRGIFFNVTDFRSSVQQRSLAHLVKHKVPLTEDHIVAISSLQNVDKMYSKDLYEVSDLTLLLQQAVRFCCTRNKDVTSLLDV